MLGAEGLKIAFLCYYCVFLSSFQTFNTRSVLFRPSENYDDFYVMWLPVGKQKGDCLLPLVPKNAGMACTQSCSDKFNTYDDLDDETRPSLEGICVDYCIRHAQRQCGLLYYIPDSCYAGGPFGNSSGLLFEIDAGRLECPETDRVKKLSSTDFTAWGGPVLMLVAFSVHFFVSLLMYGLADKPFNFPWHIAVYLHFPLFPSVWMTYQAPGVYRLTYALYPWWLNRILAFFVIANAIIIPAFFYFPLIILVIFLVAPLNFYWHMQHLRIAHLADGRYYLSPFAFCGWAVLAVILNVTWDVMKMWRTQKHAESDSDHGTAEANASPQPSHNSTQAIPTSATKCEIV